jgi:hypothetical protein
MGSRSLLREWKGTYERIKRGTQKRSKIAIVAVMRQLGIVMWQTARSPDIDQLIEEIDQRRQVA